MFFCMDLSHIVFKVIEVLLLKKKSWQVDRQVDKLLCSNWLFVFSLVLWKMRSLVPCYTQI